MTPTHLPDWAMLIFINVVSFVAVAALVLVSVAFDTFVFDLG